MGMMCLLGAVFCGDEFLKGSLMSALIGTIRRKKDIAPPLYRSCLHRALVGNAVRRWTTPVDAVIYVFRATKPACNH